MTFDYVMIGAGAAGCVLANRLTENPKIQVLLLEAGGPDVDPRIHLPVAFSKLFKSRYDWAYYTTEQRNLNGRKLFWPRGKVLGGSSSINAMIYIRGNQQDYDDWEAAGNPGWGYSDALKYFKKSENNERGANEFHGTGGPWNIADLRNPFSLSNTFLQAVQQAGMPMNPDFAAATQEGFGLYQVNQKRGARHSVVDAYLKPAMQRSNLRVVTGAQAFKLLFKDNRATTVEFELRGNLRQAHASREILLCGGAINSPQLLMLSGIGPEAHLREHRIPVTQNLPGVGQNLQDHLIIGTMYSSKLPATLAGAETLGNLLKYVFARKGPLTSNVAEGGGFFRVGDTDRPNIQFMFGPTYYVNHGFENPAGHGYAIGPILLYPKSKGQILLQSKDPLEPAWIDANYLAHASDMQLLVESLKIARKIGVQPAFDAFRGEEVFPGPATQTDEQLAQFVRDQAQTLYHPVGTCRMGTDDLSVVDARLRVHGIQGLRVVDASIMPNIVGGNTQAPTIMLAEKAADLIQADNN